MVHVLKFLFLLELSFGKVVLFYYCDTWYINAYHVTHFHSHAMYDLCLVEIGVLQIGHLFPTFSEQALQHIM